MVSPSRRTQPSTQFGKDVADGKAQRRDPQKEQRSPMAAEQTNTAVTSPCQNQFGIGENLLPARSNLFSMSLWRGGKIMDEMAEYDLISGKFRLSIRKNFHPLTPHCVGAKTSRFHRSWRQLLKSVLQPLMTTLLSLFDVSFAVGICRSPALTTQR